jgi:hypothetical protein
MGSLWFQTGSHRHNYACNFVYENITWSSSCQKFIDNKQNGGLYHCSKLNDCLHCGMLFFFHYKNIVW